MLHVHIERIFNLSSFIPQIGESSCHIPRHIYEWIHNRQWDGLVSGHKCVPDIVREFYFRGSSVVSNSYSDPKDGIVAKIRGIFVVLSPREIRELYGCPTIDLPFLPHKSTDFIEMDNIIASAIGYNLTWGSLMSIPQ